MAEAVGDDALIGQDAVGHHEFIDHLRDVRRLLRRRRQQSADAAEQHKQCTVDRSHMLPPIFAH